MSKTLHLLKFYKENAIKSDKTFTESFCFGLLCFGKKYDIVFRDIVDDFNRSNNATVIINNMMNNVNTQVLKPSKALTLHRLRLLGALVAQVKGYDVKPSLSSRLYLKDTPKRFQTKFQNILVDGFWLLGRMIADSLSDDSEVNCGNPFDFADGDLAFWWAGCVMLDWAKNESSKHKKKSFKNGYDFYIDHSIGSRKFKYYQNSGNSSFNNKLVEDFLSEEDFELFTITVQKVRFGFAEVFEPIRSYGLSYFDEGS